MEEDDEFGDLYTDVLRPLSASHPQHISPEPIDNPPTSYPNSTLPPTPPSPSVAPSQFVDSHAPPRSPDKSGGSCELIDKDVTFDIEEPDDDDAPMIPGISVEGSKRGDGDDGSEKQNGGGGAGNAIGGEEEDDWDSDSDDDLQIVLNDDHNRGGAAAMGAIDDAVDDDDDEDEDPLVIVGDADANNQGIMIMEEQEWGGDDAPGVQMVEGGAEKKEMATMGERGAANGLAGAVSVAASAAAVKIGYSNHYPYHNPYHSQFKYVRPGAAPIPGTTAVGPGGAHGQVRPLVNMGPAAGRGRGDWRPTGMKNGPPMQKSFHSGFGMAATGNNMTGRPFGVGLEFTLPSHKTIFDVDIDGFEEKPWKYPGVDVSDFFNFGLNEDSWKEYCKQLEQHRLETTMQSKIRVYESGRTDQDYDPDLPPELAAATANLDNPAENANLGKSDVGQSDLTKGSARVRPPLPTGRAIQVEGGYGERLPSIDTRPPRLRDSDAIIEIVCQGSVDDDSTTGNGDRDNDLPVEELRGGHVAEDEMGPVDSDYFDGFPGDYNGRKRELVGRRPPFMNSVHGNIPEGDRIVPFPPEASLQYQPDSRGPTAVYPSENIGNPREERRIQGRTRDRSPHLTPSRSPPIKKFQDNHEEESVESMEGKHSPISPPVTVRDGRELSVEHKDAVQDDSAPGDGSSAMEREETNTTTTNDTLKDGNSLHSGKKQKLTSLAEQPELQELDDEDDSKAARSSENSKARSGSSRDYKKWRDGVEEEVMQDGRSTRTGTVKKHIEENEQSSRRKDREGRQEMERNRMVAKGREGSYPRRDLDPSLAHPLHMKTEGFDRRKERENPGVWQRRDEDYSRKNRTEDSKKREREHGDEMGSRHRGKARESERSDKDEHLHSRKQLDNGSYRVYDKDGGSRHRERDDNLKNRYDMVDDYYSKRRKDDEYLRRDHADKDEILHPQRDSINRRKRERDDIFDQRKRDDQQRIRENFDDHHPVRHKDEAWLQRERGERPREREREREEWHRLKSHEETLSKREREEGRGAVRTGRSSEDKAWVGHPRAKDDYNKVSDKEYQSKDTVRHSEQLKRRERIEDESLSYSRGREDVYARGNQFNNEERKSRQERSGPRNDRAVHASDNPRMHEKKHKETIRKNREPEGGDHNSSGTSKRNQEDQSGLISEMGFKGTLEKGNGEKPPLHRNSSRKQKEEASSDDEQQDSKRGRSKLERWTSHKERDFSINSKSSASLKLKEIDKNNNNTGPLEASKPPEEPATAVEPIDEQQPSAEKKDVGDPEIKGADAKADDRHLDTVEKLKKRSERFKLPMPSEKDVAAAIKKMENEPLPCAKSDTPAAADSEIKQERPARKRRWVNSIWVLGGSCTIRLNPKGEAQAQAQAQCSRLLRLEEIDEQKRKTLL
ncbi:hypothetical protein EZV62_012139 [Acer yangbiense]|uniref:Pre-mRNA polyadenylation factor Fip1 domain-containing protein n=1 Tax=Acer yangbiense TaxID=1000413 RepID=A0A5C7HWR9_9ROSI|nr:hypothetical protein EZV62_012139 [Acer yangbiense]